MLDSGCHGPDQLITSTFAISGRQARVILISDTRVSRLKTGNAIERSR